MSGFGTIAFGTGPFGSGTPDAGEDPPTGEVGSRYLNPSTRDYQADPATRQLAQMPSTRQRVLLALTTELDSSAVPGFGSRLPRKMGGTYEAEVRAAIASALRQLTDVEKIVRLGIVQVERGLGGRSRITVPFTDLLSGTGESVSLAR